MTKPCILSGIQPTGRLHLGNYLGALKNFVELQNSGKYQCFFMLADYHSITEGYSPSDKPRETLSLAADFLAVGLNPQTSVIFLQSMVPQHTELAWIFDTLTPVAELARMTQYKDKASRQEKNINAGLFTYPVLQAVDILIYKSTAVPVGKDQEQHLELTNAIARRFNKKFGNTFHKVKVLFTEAPKVMGLKNPERKMSKSEPEGCLFLDDKPEAIVKKIRAAVTATVGGKSSPGVKNLFLLLKRFSTAEELGYFAAREKNGSIKYSELKTALAKAIVEYFAEYREKKIALVSQEKFLKKILVEGSTKAQKIAAQTLSEVKQKIGLMT